MTNQVIFRHTQNDDYPAIIQAYIDVFSDEPWNDVLTEAQITQYVTDMTELNTFIGYLLEDSDTHELLGCALGFIKPWYQGREYMLDTLFIRQKYQGQKLGQTFISNIKTALHHREIYTILLDTDRGTPAEKFYLATGFKPMEEALMLYLSFPPEN
ncbi:GNAT family N-acetyltransferase [Enterococcus sp. HY326]|uniref:GNAT family N-acetyltransferase n=1 Tax=Enterococcus sp. HY326 TaxID=2971265 RepID=UPI00223EEFC1|nr:GNAT family N-acetyltransferase [Enterococcus sp. HY326]